MSDKMAGSKHDAVCLSRRDADERMAFVCTCGLSDQQVHDHPFGPGKRPVLLSVVAVVTRADLTVERIDLDVQAYRRGEIEPPITLANGETVSFEESRA